MIFRFLFPIDYATVSMFASSVVGTLIGTYIAGLVIKASKVIDDNTGKIGEIVNETFEKGKEFVDDITGDKKEEGKEEPKQEEPKKPEKSARERLRDKGLLK